MSSVIYVRMFVRSRDVHKGPIFSNAAMIGFITNEMYIVANGFVLLS
jgi:hypothetical protein